MNLPVCKVCPACGASDYEKVKFEGVSLRYAADRACLNCGTQYSLPTPLWARCVFAILGLCLLAASTAAAVRYFEHRNTAESRKLALMLLPHATGCCYLAFRPERRVEPPAGGGVQTRK